MPTEADVVALESYREVLSNPRDDEPRILVASHVEATWPERARYIRAQVANRRGEREGLDPTGAESKALWKEVKSFFSYVPFGTDGLTRACVPIANVISDWVKQQVPVESVIVERGFPQRIGTDMATFASFGTKLVETIPLLRLDLDGSTNKIDDFIASPALAQLTWLDITIRDLGDDNLARILASPHLGSLRGLCVWKAGLTRDGYDHVVRASRSTIPKLELFRSEGNQVGQPHELHPSTDGMTGLPIHETEGVLPWEGRRLESEFGRLEWLHWNKFGLGLELWPYD